ncbi:NAD(P)-dependent dehydrogenase (short-subunit alcohol dehydrogenase family) [Crossiella equi]|uniref:NAD(P)-dependent dehydrogenase (Short-subunit alcohol dehydrogenase family) n=1 Tax=Crossiella equi TaxID=130796 RepID=A0ABS5ANQ3_9PSEU|nr:SDR family NAD(P)-dependent oxidoreductase [Crossiella equi]MBP2477872.1 NAD(P)-dependent dehydrogenase (short-subunit alcohol dehydrogenase family) [Crossiella equi]
MRRVALVTGGASGIGHALAAALVARGDHVVLTDRTGAPEAAAALGAQGVPLDVTDQGAVRAVVTAAVAEHGRLDLVVANAGVALTGRVEELADEDWARVLEVNLHGVVHTVRAAYPELVRQGRGRLVLMSSLAGLVPAPLAVPYTASKHAVTGLGLALRAEAAARGVGVTVVCPGFVDTPLLSGRARTLAARLQPPCSPRRVASAVLSGVAQDRALVVVPFLARPHWWLRRWAPGLADLIVRRISRS